MIHSMTGFGDASAHVGPSHYAVEIRSINNRYLKPVIRLPDALSGLEPKVESKLREKLGRGSVTFTLHLKTEAADAALEVNTAAVKSYLAALQPFVGEGRTINLPNLLTLPGVLSDPAAEPTTELRTHEVHVLKLTDKAVEALIQHRIAEGTSLQVELDRHLDHISEHLRTIAEHAPQIVKEYHRRLTARVNELITNAQLRVEEPDLIREVAVFAEKADVAEEIQRLKHHVEHFRHTCSRDDRQAGRKLDFLTQEMLREANTIGSKANDAEIAGHVVEIKGAIDRLKEQVQNVE